VTLHSDTIHRGAGQLMPTAKRVFNACQMKSGPRLMEPMYLCDIIVPQSAVSGVYSTLSQRRGTVESALDRIGTPLTQIKAFLPVMESFGFTELLRKNTSGQAFPQMIFSHWSLVGGDLTEADTQGNTIVMEVRKRKGMKEELPDFGDFYDKI